MDPFFAGGVRPLGDLSRGLLLPRSEGPAEGVAKLPFDLSTFDLSWERSLDGLVASFADVLAAFGFDEEAAFSFVDGVVFFLS